MRACQTGAFGPEPIAATRAVIGNGGPGAPGIQENANFSVLHAADASNSTDAFGGHRLLRFAALHAAKIPS